MCNPREFPRGVNIEVFKEVSVKILGGSSVEVPEKRNSWKKLKESLKKFSKNSWKHSWKHIFYAIHKYLNSPGKSKFLERYFKRNSRFLGSYGRNAQKSLWESLEELHKEFISKLEKFRGDFVEDMLVKILEKSKLKYLKACHQNFLEKTLAKIRKKNIWKILGILEGLIETIWKNRLVILSCISSALFYYHFFWSSSEKLTRSDHF